VSHPRLRRVFCDLIGYILAARDTCGKLGFSGHHLFRKVTAPGTATSTAIGTGQYLLDGFNPFINFNGKYLCNPGQQQTKYGPQASEHNDRIYELHLPQLLNQKITLQFKHPLKTHKRRCSTVNKTGLRAFFRTLIRIN